VARRIGHDKGPCRCREEAISHIDRNALFALGLESIDQQSEIDIIASRAIPAGVLVQRSELIFVNEL